jgi:hypothetical protein
MRPRPATSAAVPASRQMDAAAARGSMFEPVIGRLGLSFESALESAGTKTTAESCDLAGESAGGPPPARVSCGVMHELQVDVGVGVGVLMQELHVELGDGLLLAQEQVGDAVGLLLMQELHVEMGDGLLLTHPQDGDAGAVGLLMQELHFGVGLLWHPHDCDGSPFAQPQLGDAGALLTQLHVGEGDGLLTHWQLGGTWHWHFGGT